MSKKRIGLLSIVLVLVLCLVGASIALAQSTGEASKTGLYRLFLSKLAANLGVTESQLQEALKAAGTQTLDEAVQQGWLSSDKAQKLKEAINNGQWGLIGKFAGWCGRRKFAGGPAHGMLGDMAGILGMTPQQLRDELQSGKTLEQIVNSKGMTLEQVKEKWLAEKKAELDQRVSEGKLTAEKAQEILSRLEKLDFSRLGVKR